MLPRRIMPETCLPATWPELLGWMNTFSTPEQIFPWKCLQNGLLHDMPGRSGLKLEGKLLFMALMECFPGIPSTWMALAINLMALFLFPRLSMLLKMGNIQQCWDLGFLP